MIRAWLREVSTPRTCCWESRVIGVMRGVRTTCDIFCERKNNNDKA